MQIGTRINARLVMRKPNCQKRRASASRGGAIAPRNASREALLCFYCLLLLARGAKPKARIMQTNFAARRLRGSKEGENLWKPMQFVWRQGLFVRSCHDEDDEDGAAFFQKASTAGELRHSADSPNVVVRALPLALDGLI